MEERLRKFAALVDAGSYTKASRELHISQPALSAAISKLERELQAELLVHGNRNLKLTKAGKLAYDSAKELGIVSSNLKTRIQELLREHPAVTIGMIDSVATVLFASKKVVNEIDKQSKFSVVVNNSRNLANAVERDEVDFAFITDKPVNNSSKFIADFIANEPLVLVCHANDAAKAKMLIHKGHIPNFISYDEVSATHRLIQSSLLEYKITYTSIINSSSPSVALQLVLMQKGVAVLPYVLVKYYVDNGTLLIAGGNEPVIIKRPISLLKRRGKLPLSISVVISDNISTLLKAYEEDINNAQ